MIDKLRFNLSNQHCYIFIRYKDENVLDKKFRFICLIRKRKKYEGIIKLLSATYFTRKQVPFPSILLAHQRLLEKGEVAQYPFKNTEIKYFTISQKSSSALEENIFVNTALNRIVIGFVDSLAFNGELTSNPFRFYHYDIKSINISVNNISIPVRPLILDFEKNECLLLYYLLFTSMGIAEQDAGLSFGRDDHKGNNALFSFDIHQPTGNESLLYLEKSRSVKSRSTICKCFEQISSLYHLIWAARRSRNRQIPPGYCWTMNTVELQNILNVSIPTSSFRTFFAADQLNSVKSNQFALFVSNQSSSEPGMHWLVFYKRKGSNEAEFFDSCDMPLDFYSADFNNFCVPGLILLDWSLWEFNLLKVTLLVNFAYIFLIYRVKGCSYEQILQNFDEFDLEQNDGIFKEYVSDEFGTLSKSLLYKSKTIQNVISVVQYCEALDVLLQLR